MQVFRLCAFTVVMNAKKPLKMCRNNRSVLGAKIMMHTPADAFCDAASCCGAETDACKCGGNMNNNQLPH